MIKSLILLLLICITFLEARDNPFCPVEQDQQESLHKPIPIPDFKPKPIQVVIKKEINLEINTTIIKPLVSTQKSHIKTVLKPYIKPKKTTYIHKKKYIQIYTNTTLKVYIKSNHIKIKTQDLLLKPLHLQKPNRLVLDFGNDFVIYKSFKKDIRSQYIKGFEIGTHPCFYRITFLLKIKKHYKIKHTSYGYLITFLP